MATRERAPSIRECQCSRESLSFEVSASSVEETSVIRIVRREQQSTGLRTNRERRLEMYYGFGRGRGFGRGMGFGFRGVSPPWPYVGRGRGGLPRCGYFFGGGAAYPRPVYGPPLYGWGAADPGYAPYAAATAEEEIGYLRGQAESIRTELDSIESRMRNLEGKQQ